MKSSKFRLIRLILNRKIRIFINGSKSELYRIQTCKYHLAEWNYKVFLKRQPSLTDILNECFGNDKFIQTVHYEGLKTVDLIKIYKKISC